MTAQLFILSLKNKNYFYITPNNTYICHDCAEKKRATIMDVLLKGNSKHDLFVLYYDDNLDADDKQHCDHCNKKLLI